VYLLVAIALLLAMPFTAQAKLVVPAEVVPGESVLVDGGPELLGGVVTLRPEGAKVVAGVAGTPFVWPLSYDGRRFVPGQRVDVDVCSVPVTTVAPGLMTSSMFCESAQTVIGGRAPEVRLKRITRLAGARWSGWGAATARGRGRRGLTAMASAIVDCDGRLWYSAVDIRAGRRVRRLRGLAPC
jgi:hypothetical protein